MGLLAAILPITWEELACRTQQSRRRSQDTESGPEVMSEPLDLTMSKACYPYASYYLSNTFLLFFFNLFFGGRNLVSVGFLVLITKIQHECVYSKLYHSQLKPQNGHKITPYYSPKQLSNSTSLLGSHNIH